MKIDSSIFLKGASLKKSLFFLLIFVLLVLPFVNANQAYFPCAGNSHFVLFCGSSTDSQFNNPFVTGASPIIQITSPYNKVNDTFYLNSTNINLSYTVTSPSGLSIDSCWYNLNGTNVSLPGCLSTNIKVAGEGEFTIDLFSNDSAGKTNSTSGAFIVDTSPPVITLKRHNINVSQDINLNITVTDNNQVDTVTASVTYPDSTIKNLILSKSGNQYLNDTLNLTLPGEYEVNYTANDIAGNIKSAEDWFEVYKKYSWNLSLTDYDNNPESGIDIDFFRPNTDTSLLYNWTDLNGFASFDVNERFYDFGVFFYPPNFILDRYYPNLYYNLFLIRNLSFVNPTFSRENLSLNFYQTDGGALLNIIPLFKPFVGIASDSKEISSNPTTVRLNYYGYSYDSPIQLKVIKCKDWNYTSRDCLGSWIVLNSLRNSTITSLSANSTGSGAYFLVENKCGNGACELNYGENATNCPADCKPIVIVTSSSGSSGGSSGGGTSTVVTQIVQKGFKVDTTSIYRELFPGGMTTFQIQLENPSANFMNVSISDDGDSAKFLSFETTSVRLKPYERREFLIRISVPKNTSFGNYPGNLIFSEGGKIRRTPVAIMVLQTKNKLLDLKVTPFTTTIAPGGYLKVQTDLMNLGGTSRVDVEFDLQLLNLYTGKIIIRKEEALAVETRLTKIVTLPIPKNLEPGRYMIKGVAHYSNPQEKDMQATSIVYINVRRPFFKKKFFGAYLWMEFLFLLLLAGLFVGRKYLKHLNFLKKRFKIKTDLKDLPLKNEHSGMIGKIAETGVRAFADLSKMQMHTLFAGSTGSGKTIAAQDFAEVALMHKKGVLVFDPTSQWTGFLKKNEEAGMLRKYKDYGMKVEDARAFSGTIKTIRDPYELIDMKKYLSRSGEIVIFDMSHLKPKEIDVFISSTIEQIFESEPPESDSLKTLLVYDEVHRLLPKFGGSGKGFLQLERGVREFRKWGLGLILISQVLSDFVGGIKANIGTEIQMGTRYRGDLDRINMKYGEDILKSIVKEPIGTGMIINAGYNEGLPYFVSFRPTLHSPSELPNKLIEKYEKYSDFIEDLSYQLKQLKKQGMDTFDFAFELNLAEAKVKIGDFQTADIYLQSVVPAIEKNWKDLKKKPEHLATERILRKDIFDGEKKAEKGRREYLKKNEETKISLDEVIDSLKKKLDAKMREGKDTRQASEKLRNLLRRVQPFRGKVLSPEIVESMNREFDNISKLIDAL